MLALRISFSKHLTIDNGMISVVTGESLGHMDTDTPELLCGVRGPSAARGRDASPPCLPAQYKELKAISLQASVGCVSEFISY